MDKKSDLLNKSKDSGKLNKSKDSGQKLKKSRTGKKVDFSQELTKGKISDLDITEDLKTDLDVSKLSKKSDNDKSKDSGKKPSALKK